MSAGGAAVADGNDRVDALPWSWISRTCHFRFALPAACARHMGLMARAAFAVINPSSRGEP